MRKLLLLTTIFLAGASAKADIVVNQETSNYLELSFYLSDTLLTPGSDIETYTLNDFPGTSFTFNFRDRLFLLGNQESLSTNPSSGTFSFVQNTGNLDFSGSYTIGGTLVNWWVDSVVTTGIIFDTWSGTLKATATGQRVPDAGTSIALLGLGLLGLAIFRRKVA